MSKIVLKGFTSGQTTIQSSDIAGTTTITIPAADDTLVGKNTNDILSNKTIDGSTNTITLSTINTQIDISVDNLATLKTLTKRPSAIILEGRNTPGDGAGGIFYWMAGDTTTPDDGIVVQCTSGPSGRYKRIFNGRIDVRWFGARGDGITNDQPSIQAACGAAQANGSEVYIPPSGAAYVINTTIALGNGVKLVGSGSMTYPGPTAPISTWTASGTWLKPTHASNAAVRLQGHGSAIEGINFIYDQPTPTGGWIPNTYGYAIWQTCNHAYINNVRIINASHGIHIDYTGSGGGTNCWMRDIMVSAYNIRIKTTNVNDTMYWSDIHCRNLWQMLDANVTAYIRANTIGWDCGYTDNIMVDGLELFEDHIGIQFTDGTVLAISHSLYNATLNNIQFNLPQIAMKVAANNTTVLAHFGTTLSQTGNAFGYTWSDTMFQLASDNIDITFNKLSVIDAGGRIMDLGNGTGGKIKCGILDIWNYSTIAAGQVGFNMSANSKINAGNIIQFNKNVSANVRVAGAGYEYFTTDRFQSWNVFSTFAQVTINGTGAYVGVSVDNHLRPGLARIYQVRLVGELNITTPIAASSCILRLAGGISGVTTTSIPTTASGFQSFDTGWIDIPEADLNSSAILGRLQQNTTSGVQWTNGTLTVLMR